VRSGDGIARWEICGNAGSSGGDAGSGCGDDDWAGGEGLFSAAHGGAAGGGVAEGFESEFAREV